MFDGQSQQGIAPLHKTLAMDERHYPAEYLNIGIAHGNHDHVQAVPAAIACDIFARQLGENAPQTLDCHKKLNVTFKYL